MFAVQSNNERHYVTIIILLNKNGKTYKGN